MKWYGWVLIGGLLAVIAWLWIDGINRQQVINEQALEWERQIQASRDSIGVLQRKNDDLLDDIKSSRANIERLNRRVAALIEAGQQQDNQIVLLPPDETVRLFDSLTGDFPASAIAENDSNAVLTHSERIRDANRGLVGLHFTLEELAVKSLLIASQDSVINYLEAVRVNDGIHIGQLERIIAVKDEQLNEYDRVISEAIKKRKIDNWIKGTLFGALVVALFLCIFILNRIFRFSFNIQYFGFFKQ